MTSYAQMFFVIFFLCSIVIFGGFAIYQFIRSLKRPRKPTPVNYPDWKNQRLSELEAIERAESEKD